MSKPKPRQQERFIRPTRHVIYRSDWKSGIVAGLHYVRPVTVISTIMQMAFGMLIVAISLLGMITPLWVATICNVFGCIITVIGGYQLIDLFRRGGGRTDLVNEAMRSAIDFRN